MAIGISMIAGETIQCRPSVVDVLSVSVYADVSTDMTRANKQPSTAQRVGYGVLPNAGADTTIVSALASGYYYGEVVINIANSDTVNRTIRVYHVESGGSPSTSNRLAYDSVVPANGALTINANGISA